MIRVKSKDLIGKVQFTAEAQRTQRPRRDEDDEEERRDEADV
jgi:hypothetical protein